MSSTLKGRITKEIEDLPSELQETIIELVRSMKKEMLASTKAKPRNSDGLLLFSSAVMEVVD